MRTEQLAFDRCAAVLQNHPMVLLAPESLDLRGFALRLANMRAETFPDECFKSPYFYNRLMLSDAFYERFAAYDYILIHQLDAFVFSDQLMEWCRRGYDYVGAPWIWSTRTPTPTYRFYRGAVRVLCRWMGRSTASARRLDKPFLRQLAYAAGNGGFSLRRVVRMRQMLAALPARAELYRSAIPGVASDRPAARWSEDVFFSVEANRYRRNVKIPSLRIAARFAWETNPAIAARLTGGSLPFGCHGWYNLHRDQWRPVFARLGCDLDAISA
jgi:Protein of unknown function (DUF5672)